MVHGGSSSSSTSSAVGDFVSGAIDSGQTIDSGGGSEAAQDFAGEAVESGQRIIGGGGSSGGSGGGSSRGSRDRDQKEEKSEKEKAAEDFAERTAEDIKRIQLQGGGEVSQGATGQALQDFAGEAVESGQRINTGGGRSQDIDRQRDKTGEDQVQRDPGTIQRAEDISFSQAARQTGLAFQQQGFGAGLSTGFSSFSDWVTQPVSRDRQRQRELQRDRQRIQRGEFDVLGFESPEDRQRERQEDIQKGLTRTPEGATIQRPGEQRLENLAATGEISEEAAAEEIGRQAAQEETIPLREQQFSEQQRLDQIRDNLSNRVRQGDLSPDEAQAMFEQKRQEAQGRLQQTAERETRDVQQRVEESLGDIGVKSAAADIPQMAAIGAATGGIVGAGGAAVRTGAQAVGTGLSVIETSRLANQVARGQAGVQELTAFGISNAALGAGFLAGSKVAGSARGSARRTKVRDAIDRSEIEVQTEGTLSQKQIKNLKVPESAKESINQALQTGRSARRVKARIRPRGQQDKELLDRELPESQAEFVEVTDASGNVVNRIAVGEARTAGRSGKVFKQDIVQESTGEITGQGSTETTTFTRIAPQGKQPRQARVTRERATGQEAEFTFDEQGNLVPAQAGQGDVRLASGESTTELLAEARGRPLTQDELDNLLRQGTARQQGDPLSQEEFLELQRRTQSEAGLNIQTEDDIIQAFRSDRFVTGGRGVSRRDPTLEDQTTKKGKVDRRVRNLADEAKLTPEQKKALDEASQPNQFGEGGNIQVQGQSGQLGLDTPRNIRTGGAQGQAAQQAFRSAAQEVVGVQGARSVGAFASAIGQDAAQIQDLQQQFGVQDFAQSQQGQQAFGQADTASLAQARAQLDQQAEQFQQQTFEQAFQQAGTGRFAPPGFKPPKAPKAPKTFESDLEKNLQQLNKELASAERPGGEFTASLPAAFGGEAAAQAAPQVTPEQLEQLGQQQFTGFEVRPLVELVEGNSGQRNNKKRKGTKKKTTKKKRSR